MWYHFTNKLSFGKTVNSEEIPELQLIWDEAKGHIERSLGWAEFNSGDRTEGIGHLYRALELLPYNIHAMTDLATAMLMLGNMEKAREYGEKALSFDPNYILAQDLLKMSDRVEGK